jgi:hypothetical protein
MQLVQFELPTDEVWPRGQAEQKLAPFKLNVNEGHASHTEK